MLQLSVDFTACPSGPFAAPSVWCARASEFKNDETHRIDTNDVVAARNGDHGAFERIVSRHQSVITTQMLRFTRDRLVVESLVQDVFVEAFTSLRTYRGEAPILHWLRRIAVRVGYRFWKHSDRERARIARTSAPMDEAATELTDGAEEAADRLHGHLDRLSPRDRLVLTLVYWDDLSVVEIANLTGWSRTSVKVQMFRARRRLKKIIEKAEADHERE